MTKSANKIVTLNILSTILLQGIAFFTVPIFTRMLGADQYGAYSVFFSWVGILTSLMGLGVPSTLATGRYEFKDSYYEFRSSILLFSTFISLIILTMGSIFIHPISKWLGYSELLVILVYLASFSNCIIGFIQNACTYEKRADINLVISIFLSLSSPGLSIYLIHYFKDSEKFMGRVYGTVIPYSIVAVVLWIVFFKNKPTGLHLSYCRFGLTVGVPVVFHSLAQKILSQSDRVMMQRMGIERSEIGIYSLFYTLSSVLSIVLNALNTSWCPFYYDDLDTGSDDRLKRKCKNYVELFTILTCGFLMFSREVSYILADDSYRTGIDVIPMIVISVYFTFMYQFPVNFEFFHKKTNVIALGTLGAAMVNFLLNYLMIPLWGMYGAALATALAYGALFLLHYWIVTHKLPVRFHLNAVVFLPGLIVVSLGIVIFYTLAEAWYIRWGVGVLLGVYELARIFERKTIF